MQCGNCGKALTSEDTFCSNCGTAVKKEEEHVDVSEHFSDANTPSTGIGIASPQTSVNQPIPISSNQVEEKAALTPPEDKPVDAPMVQEELQSGRKTSFIEGTEPQNNNITTEVVETHAAPVVEVAQTVVAQPQVETVQVAEPAPVEAVQEVQVTPEPQIVAPEPVPIVEDPVGFGPAPIVDPPVAAPSIPYAAAPQPAYIQQPRGGIAKKLIFGVLALFTMAFIGIGAYFGTIALGTINNVKEEKKSPDIVDSNTTEVSFAGAKFSIPSDRFDYELDSERLAIYNDDIYFYIMTAPSKYSQYLVNIPLLKKHYQDLGYNVSSASEESVGSQKYIILNVSNDDGKVSLFIRKFTNTHSLTGAIARTDDSFATNKDLSDVESILSTSQIVTKSSKEEKTILGKEILKGIIEATFEESNEK